MFPAAVLWPQPAPALLMAIVIGALAFCAPCRTAVQVHWEPRAPRGRWDPQHFGYAAARRALPCLGNEKRSSDGTMPQGPSAAAWSFNCKTPWGGKQSNNARKPWWLTAWPDWAPSPTWFWPGARRHAAVCRCARGVCMSGRCRSESVQARGGTLAGPSGCLPRHLSHHFAIHAAGVFFLCAAPHHPAQAAALAFCRQPPE
jgi:hypothetical protein